MRRLDEDTPDLIPDGRRDAGAERLQLTARSPATYASLKRPRDHARAEPGDRQRSGACSQGAATTSSSRSTPMNSSPRSRPSTDRRADPARKRRNDRWPTRKPCANSRPGWPSGSRPCAARRATSRGWPSECARARLPAAARTKPAGSSPTRPSSAGAHAKPWFLGVANLRGGLHSWSTWRAFLGVRRRAAPRRPGRDRAQLVAFNAARWKSTARCSSTKLAGLRSSSQLAPRRRMPDSASASSSAGASDDSGPAVAGAAAGRTGPSPRVSEDRPADRQRAVGATRRQTPRVVEQDQALGKGRDPRQEGGVAGLGLQHDGRQPRLAGVPTARRPWPGAGGYWVTGAADEKIATSRRRAVDHHRGAADRHRRWRANCTMAATRASAPRRRLPLIGNRTAGKQQRILGGVVLAGAVGPAVQLDRRGDEQRRAGARRRSIPPAGKALMQSQRLARSVSAGAWSATRRRSRRCAEL